MKILMFAFLGLGLVATASARIGEDQAQMTKRYGVPREDRGNKNATVKANCTKTYDAQGWTLETHFADGAADAIVYRRNDGKPMQAPEIQSILDAESGGGKWTKVREGVWSNSNGTSAGYDSVFNLVRIKPGPPAHR